MRLVILTAAFAVMAAAAFAGDEDVMATRYGNTTKVKDLFGTSFIHYNKDHTFQVTSWLGDVSGTWKFENGKMCLYAEKYPALYRLKYSIPECDIIEPHKVGDKWKSGSREYELVAGKIDK